jgi:hypothetical protein
MPWRRAPAHGERRQPPQWAQHFVTPQRSMPVMAPSSSPFPLWLVRPRSDGGSDYVRFLPSAGHGDAALVEVREGSHLPPQMPLLKRRQRLPAAEAEACRRHLQQEAGYHRSDPLF